jgi:adenylate cyclase
MVEEITAALSRMAGLFVIARNSSFTYKGRSVDVRQVGQELGVRYVVEGSVRRAGDRVRITGQLVEAATGAHLWSDRFEGTLADAFDLQDRTAEGLAGAIEPTLRRAEIERAHRKPTDSLDAYDLFLRALPLVLAMTPKANSEALQLLHRALALDPEYAVASALRSWCHGQRYQRGWGHANEAQEQEAAESAARHALAAGQNDPTALAIAGYIVALVARDFDAGTHALRRALVLNPNSALALGHMAVVHCLVGDYAAVINEAEQSIRLSPLDPMIYLPLVALAYAHLFTGRAEIAFTHACRAVEARPGFDVPDCVAVAALVELGRLDEARYAAGRLLAKFPDFRIARRRRAGWRDVERREAFIAALRKAGLPE